MQVNCEWNAHPDLFEAVAEALENNETGFEVNATTEQSPYCEDGTITICTLDGRTFKLVLAEVI